MSTNRRLATWSAVAFLTAVSAARAQNAPHLAYVLPAGGQQGTSFQAVVGGQFLPNVKEAYLSGKGIQVQVTDYQKPMAAKQATELRARLEELRKQPAEPEVEKEIADIRAQLLLYGLSRNTSPALAETVTLQITMAADAAPGKRELRLATPKGLSNPLVFHVGQLPEFAEREPVPVSLQPGAKQPQLSQAATDMSITLPAIVNGRIKPRPARPEGSGRPGQESAVGDVDRYRFPARQGQQLVVAVGARELIPYLADAVPGWFQATIALFDVEGRELAFDDDYRFHPDPVLQYRIPKDGEYAIEIRDALYRGREDFVYRIAIGELPFITSVFPLGGRAGTRTSLELLGWNLPTKKLTLDARGRGVGVYPVSVRRGTLASNEVPFQVGSLPEGDEKERNDSAKGAQRIQLPLVVNGRIQEPGDEDVFAFEGRAGQEMVAEVQARRLDSPLDSVLKLTDAAGRQLAFNDDHEDKGSGLDTHHADSMLAARLPASGTYYLRLSDAQQKGGPEYAYRLRVSQPLPDFELRVVPSGINVPGGGTVPLAVHTLRKDGFAGDIELALRDAPAGFGLSGAVVPGSQSQVRLTLTVPPMPPAEPLSLRLVGRAMVQSREIERVAVPADDMMQAFAYRHLVPAQELTVAVRGGRARGAARAVARFLEVETLKIAPGGTVRVRLQLPPTASFPGKIRFELSDPPEGITIGDLATDQQPTEIVLQADAARARLGLRGNLIVNVIGERSPAAGEEGQRQASRRVTLGTLPALPFEIVAP